ncbi:MAG: 2-amino-4-hydroxy-6-hydroxymethyldihydropteridine diphosphokinase [Rhodospirillales bacterium]|nr:2-amino-4-hydroxy-6-hydroxymethyldihydropteridine diphosphokinase [Rhodospirillales bacterium]MDH3791124.1 2-amino-4-hydroxy-6-hydroxymethyldihydropteridine diphosphokinase [Rhodospirillales bacterium]MDH3913592.1 2-amino-4-hydroxy-6-hydroxymethyldihydropteridine diphosphokinase [Rhodospirillales bacterium]MDH3919762.1 2-amino-4-hydroxy-6-hydroxymethyldihydropteridine diphosphokinase [Rhodospirillales bacterium]MDH3966656.1 2-amino-4-hydroxy-6-hydroxymethyldihydropteridine diphosphokinase [R
MIFIGIGANLPHPEHGPPRKTCEAALAALTAAGLRVLRRSRWYESEPMPTSDQPRFINGVAEVATELAPAELLERLHRVEADFGRVRHQANEARVLDLDLLAYRGCVSAPGASPVLPHPRLAERAFVVLPLAELAPDWRHPVSGLSAAGLVGRLPAGQTAWAIEAAAQP